jgi:hypothetical protein
MAATVVATYATARAVAIKGLRQPDVVAKLPSEHWDDVCRAVVVGVAFLLLFPNTPCCPLAIVMPAAAFVFAVVSDIKALHSDLTHPSIGLTRAVVASGALLLALLSYLLYTEPAQLRGALARLCACTAWVAIEYAVALLDRRRKTHTRVHVHHMLLGSAIAVVFGGFAGTAGRIMAATGLAIAVHGAAVYRPTSSFCDFVAPCRAMKHWQVPTV